VQIRRGTRLEEFETARHRRGSILLKKMGRKLQRWYKIVK
jgi:hypothetical protein